MEAQRDRWLTTPPNLALTGLYNRLKRRREALNGGSPLTEAEREDHARALVPGLSDPHDDIDRASLGAWGWDDLALALVGRTGATLPSDLKAPDQEAAEDALLARLEALNAERRAEEARGQVRWLRPAYQAPRLGARVPTAVQTEADVTTLDKLPGAQRWPEEPRAQFRAVRDLLDAAEAPLSAEAVARAFKGRFTPRRRKRVGEVLAIMADLRLARATPDARLYAARG